MPKLRAILSLMAIMAVIIIATAIYLAINYSTMGLTQGIVLIAVAVAGLLVFMVVLIAAMRNAGSKK
jgi:hypothetical protein